MKIALFIFLKTELIKGKLLRILSKGFIMLECLYICIRKLNLTLGLYLNITLICRMKIYTLMMKIFKFSLTIKFLNRKYLIMIFENLVLLLFKIIQK